MIHSDRVRERLVAVGLNQSELARRVQVTQGAIAKIAKHNPNGSSHLHKIARELRTTPAYLTGETDDPDENAPPPEPVATTQHVLMPVEIPAEPALEAMFRGLIRSMPGVTGDELAHELAKLLPIGLQQLRGPLRYVPLDHDDMQPASSEDHDAERRARRRVSSR